MQPNIPAPTDLQLLVLLPVQRQGDWLDACLMVGGGHEIQLTQVATAHQMAEQLREYIFDLLLFWHEGTQGPALATCRQLAEMADHQGFAAIGMHAPEGWQHQLLRGGALACLDLDQLDPVSLVHALRGACELIRLRQDQLQWQLDRKRQQDRDALDVQRLLSANASCSVAWIIWAVDRASRCNHLMPSVNRTTMSAIYSTARLVRAIAPCYKIICSMTQPSRGPRSRYWPSIFFPAALIAVR